MNVSISYLGEDNLQTSIYGTGLLIAKGTLSLVRESEQAGTEERIFTYDDFWFVPEGTASWRGSDVKEIDVRTVDGRPLALSVEPGQKLIEAPFFQFKTTGETIVIVDARGDEVALWQRDTQSWWLGGDSLGPRLLIGEPLFDFTALAIVPTVRERLSPLAERRY
jgi:hypothetical protein